MLHRCLFVACSLLVCVSLGVADDAYFAGVDAIVERAIAEGETAGAVVVVANPNEILYQRAFGNRQVEPSNEPMTLDTVFDLASITKPLATATSVMKLVDAGKVDVSLPVVEYLKEFAPHGKDEILVSQLLLHTGGLIPDNALADYQDGPQKAWQRICELKPVALPGEKFSYTDVGFIVLGELVKRVSERSLDQFSQAEIYRPLGMQETMFNPSAELRKRAAATEQRDGRWMKGEVHDPRAYSLGGVAGHAGLFSTAGDLVKFGRAMLACQSKSSESVLSAKTFQLMTEPRVVPRGLRTNGWDNLSPYSRNRGTKLSPSAFGHGGFTGTVLWIDPEKELIYIFLGTRLHPDGKGGINGLAGKIADILATVD